MWYQLEKETNIFKTLKKDLFGCFTIEKNEAMTMEHVWKRKK